MVWLATPISTLFENEAVAREIIAQSDCLECREHTLDSSAPRQYLIHFDKEIIHPWGVEDKDLISRAVDNKKEVRLISFHMACCCGQPVIREGRFQLGGEVFPRQQMLDFARENSRWLKAQWPGRSMEIAVENNNYYPTPAYAHISDADFITAVVEQNDLRFLFDLAHAKIAAHNRRLDYAHYVGGLPMRRMVQLHVSQHAVNAEGLAYDAHQVLAEDLQPEVQAILKRFAPAYLTIEYYKDKDNLLRLLKEYKALGK